MKKQLISPEYQKLNLNFHAKSIQEGKPWGVSGRKYVKPVVQFANELGAKTILDYGCGSGTLKKGIEEKVKNIFQISEYDPCVMGKNLKRPEKADLVVNTDVMEHIEPEFINNVLYEIYNRCTKGVFMVIATVSSNEWLTSEINAHRTVQSADWWINRIKALDIPIDQIMIEPKKVYIWIKRPEAKEFDGYRPLTKKKSYGYKK